jgi:CheY-like chemotaxis protein
MMAGERILIVEDNPVNLKLAQVILQSAGYVTEGVRTADAANTAIRERTPQLIMMDIGLPGKDGFALTRELKSEASTSQIPILVVTSYAMKSDRSKAFEAGCDGYLTKPIDRIALLDEVRDLLDEAVKSSPGQ